MNEHQVPELDSRPQSRREWSGWLRSIILPLGLVVAIIVGLLYLQSGGGAKDDGFGTVALPEAKNTTAQSPAASEGRAAPDFLLQTLDGQSVRLSDLQGQPLLINFWASWCGPCKTETPDLINIYEKNRGQGLLLLGVNLRQADTAVRDFVDDFGVTYPVAFDRRGEVASTWQIGGPNQGLPSTYFIDRDGVVRKVVLGSLTPKQATDGLHLILPEGS
jgi:cytochrome c biogenesis protein CcmG, thiol:disulfide interchange protein DsbE